MKQSPWGICGRFSLRFSGMVSRVVCFFFLLSIPAVASFRITCPYPNPPEFINNKYRYARVGFGNGVFTVFGDYVYNHRDSGLLAWGQPFVTRVTPQGIVLDSIPVLPALARDGWYTQHSNTSLGPPPFDGAYFHLVYTRSVPDTLWLHDSRIGPSGPLVDSVSVPLVRYGVQSNNGCAFGDSTYLLAWIDRRNGVKNITYAARIRRDRTALDTLGFKVNLLDSAIATGDYIADVAYNGSVFLVAWGSVGGQVWASRVTEGGAVLDSTPIRLTKGIAQWPMVASDGRDFLVTFSLEDTLLGCNTVSGCRVSGGGVVLDSIPLRISARCSSGVRTFRGLTFNGWDYQVLWNEIYQDGGKVFGARVNSAGLVKDTLQPPLFPDGLWGNQAKPAAAASPGGKVLVVWVRTLIGDLHAYGAFLDTTGREGVEEQTSSVNPVPLRFELAGNAPNPWASGTGISYTLPREAQVVLRVYNPTGQLVRTLVEGKESAGFKQVAWDGRDEAGRRVPSGVYFYRLQAGAFSDTKKMVVIR
jgi:hypothetical protein